MVENKKPSSPHVNPSLTIFYMEITFPFFNLTSIPICGNSFLPKVTGMLTWLLFSPQNLSFWFKTRPIFCQTLWLRTFENYLLVESAFVVRNSRTLFSKLYHPCFRKIHKFYKNFSFFGYFLCEDSCLHIMCSNVILTLTDFCKNMFAI